MGKKIKSSLSSRPNAPELQQILLNSPTNQQPAHNPYYLNLESDYSQQQDIPPPPYSDLAVTNRSSPYINNSLPMATIKNPTSSYRPPNIQQAPTVIIQSTSPITHIDRRIEKRNNHVRKFNSEMAGAAMMIILLSVAAYILFTERPCIESNIVQKVGKNSAITYRHVKEFQNINIYGAVLVLVICFGKFCCMRSDHHGCYVFLMSVSLFFITILSGYVAYLSFYSPCTTEISQNLVAFGKTIINTFSDETPRFLDKEIANANNVFQWTQQDIKGVWIFLIDVFNFIIFLSGFFSAVSLR